MMGKVPTRSAALLSLCFICFAGPVYAAQPDLTNPLLRYCQFRELKPFKHKVEELIKTLIDAGLAKRVSVYFRSLSDGMWFGVKEREPYCPASLLKVPVMIAYLKRAEKDPGLLESKLEYKHTGGVLSQNILGDVPLVVGQRYTVDKLIGLMISESDNTADGVLCENLGDEELADVFVYLGIDLKNRGATDDFVSVKSYAALFRVLYNGAFLNKEMSQKALGYLANSKFKDGIVAGVPKGITVAHKFGERFLIDTGKKQLHETGIIYYPGNVYILSVMTQGVDFKNLAEVIREISRLVYGEVDSQVKNWRTEELISDY